MKIGIGVTANCADCGIEGECLNTRTLLAAWDYYQHEDVRCMDRVACEQRQRDNEKEKLNRTSSA